MKKRIARADIWLILVLFFIGFASLCLVRIQQCQTGGSVTITVGGKEIGTYSLSAEQTIPIQTGGETGNTLVISGGKANMTDATCPDRLCVRQRSVSRQGETIVCLPHKVVVEVTGGQEAVFDSMSR